jgi:hypothetical protein
MYFEVRHGYWTYDGDAGGNIMSKSDGGKGSSPRPYSVTQQEYDARWDLIFSRDNDVGRDKGDKERDVAFDKQMDNIEEEQDK